MANDDEDLAECQDCGGSMGSAEDAECMSAKCSGFRAWAAEHQDDPEGDALDDGWERMWSASAEVRS